MLENGAVGPAAADDWACTSHTRTSLILECVRLGIEDGATAAADPTTNPSATCRVGHAKEALDGCGRSGGERLKVLRQVRRETERGASE